VISTAPAPRAPRRIRIRWIRAAVLIAAVAAVAVALGHQSVPSSSLPARTPSRASSAPRAAPPLSAPRSRHRGALGEADSAVPAGTTVFDDDVPGVASLDSALLGALREAAMDASADGVEFVVDSGRRSRAYQARLFRDAIAKYGSEQEAARWVATPNTSAHVSGDAVDIGPSAAAAWLSAHGAAYGLCQIYRNEPWHYELRQGAVAHGCPGMYADPTHDPRMQEGSR
jgi:D-alanyl-D-alanine carboxypeptidase